MKESDKNVIDAFSSTTHLLSLTLFTLFTPISKFHVNYGTDANIIDNGNGTTTFTFYPLVKAGCTDTTYAASNPQFCSGSYADGDKWTTSDSVEHFGFHDLAQDSGAKYIFYIRFYIPACSTNTLGYQPGSYTIANGTVTLVYFK